MDIMELFKQFNINKILLLIVAILISVSAWSQEEEYYSEPELEKNRNTEIQKIYQKNNTKENYKKFRATIYAGYSYRTVSLAGLTAEERLYYKSLLNAFHVGANAVFYFKYIIGIGLEYEYNYFTTKNYLTLVSDDGTLFYFREKINLNQIVPTVNLRFKSKTKENSGLFLSFGIGYIRYYDKALIKEDIKGIELNLLSEEAHTYCEFAKIGYELGITHKLSAIFSFSIQSATANSTIIIDHTTGERNPINLDTPLGISRLQFSTGFRF